MDFENEPNFRLSKQDLQNYLVDESLVTANQKEFIEREFLKPDTAVSKWFDELSRRLSADGQDVAWKEILNETGNENKKAE